MGKSTMGFIIAGLGLLMVIAPALLKIFGIDAGRIGEIVEVLGALKIGLGGWMQPQLGGEDHA